MSVRASQVDVGDERTAEAGAAAEPGTAQRTLARQREALQAAEARIAALTRANARLEREVRELAQREAQAQRLACHDELTGLPNRRLLHDRLAQACAQAARQHVQVALLLLDLDDFKSVNDRLGHAAGDSILRMVAQRLSGTVRAADTACRYGGDEFVILLHAVADDATVVAVVDKLQAALGAPYTVGDYDIGMTVSVGVALCGDGPEAALELLAHADRDLYRAKDVRRAIRITPRTGPAPRRAAPRPGVRYLEPRVPT